MVKEKMKIYAVGGQQKQGVGGGVLNRSKNQKILQESRDSYRNSYPGICQIGYK